MAPRKISAKEVMIDIRAGLSNDEIGQKYGLSENGIRSLLDQLLNANLLTVEERYERVGSPPAEPVLQSGPITQEGQQHFSPKPAEFIDVSKQGRNQWWRYLAGILFILIFATVIMGIVIGVFAPNSSVDKTTGGFTGIDSFYNYILQNLWFVFLFAAIFLVVRVEHKRPFRSLITPDQSMDWRKIGKSFGVFWALLFCVLVVDYVLDPASFQFRLDTSRFLWFAPTVLVLTPIQTTTEELFCRGYLLQMMALVTRNRFALVFISGVLFTLPHLANPEVALGFWTMALYYFAFGGFLTLVTLKSNGLEVAIGIHAATNLFSGLVVNYENSALKTEPIFFCSVFDPVGSLVAFCILAVAFYLLMFGGRLSLRKPWIIWKTCD